MLAALDASPLSEEELGLRRIGDHLHG